MRIHVHKKGPVAILHVSGKMTIGDSIFNETFGELLDGGERLFVVNMLACPYTDSAGLGDLIANWKRVRERRGSMKLVASGKVHELLSMTQLTRVFEIFDDEEESLASFIGEVVSAGAAR